MIKLVQEKEDRLKKQEEETSTVKRYLELSTIHIKPSTFAKESVVYKVADSQFGSIYWVPSKKEDDLSFIDAQESFLGIMDLFDVLKYAQSHNCKMIVFDCDGEEIEELPKYQEDWDRSELFCKVLDKNDLTN